VAVVDHNVNINIKYSPVTLSALEPFVARTVGLAGDVTSMCLPFPVLRCLRCTQRQWSCPLHATTMCRLPRCSVSAYF